MIGSILNLFRQNPPIVDQSYRTTPLTAEQAMEKMLRNGEKAILEHKKIGSVFASATQAIPSKQVLEQKEITSLNLKHTFADDIGTRKEMQDAHFYIEIEQGTLIGVFDGHGPEVGGKEVSNYASQEFQKRFPAVLKAHNGDVFRAFEVLIHEIHQEVARKPEWNDQGSTAVISFIDKATHQIITATLGDSEANIFRGEKLIPLSPVRDWSSRKDGERLEKAMGLPKGYVAKCVEAGMNPKRLRWWGIGVNVSRAIGDINSTGTLEKPGVIHKPKITINKLQKGDILTLWCDGVPDFASDSEIAATIVKSKAEGLSRNAWTIRNIARWVFNWIMTTIFCRKPVEEGIALDLVNLALSKYTRERGDNVTVFAVEVS